LNRSRDIIGAAEFKVGHMTLTTPLLRVFVISMLRLDIAYLCTKLTTLASAVPEIWMITITIK